jgi:hypothetical protein
MNKKLFFALFLPILSTFFLSGCSLVPKPLNFEPKDIPSEEVNEQEQVNETEEEKVATTTEQAVATSTEQVYQEGLDYIIDYPPSYFVEPPTVSKIDCDLSKECPCVVAAGYEDKEDFCKRIATSTKQGQFCVQKWSEGAAGSTYTSYVYAKALASSTNSCVSLSFTKRTVTSCSVYEGDSVKVKNCEAENAMIPAMIERVVSSWKMPASSSVDRLIKETSELVVKALKDGDMKTLSSLVGKGKLCFSPYANVKAGANCFFGNELTGAMDDKLEYIWGSYDGSGEQIVLNFSNYYKKFIYDKDYFGKGKFSFGDPVSRGNTLNNIKDVYPDSIFSEFYVEPTEEGGMDWGSLIFVFDQSGGQLMLKAIVHDQWTI